MYMTKPQTLNPKPYKHYFKLLDLNLMISKIQNAAVGFAAAMIFSAQVSALAGPSDCFSLSKSYNGKDEAESPTSSDDLLAF